MVLTFHKIGLGMARLAEGLKRNIIPCRYSWRLQNNGSANSGNPKTVTIDFSMVECPYCEDTHVLDVAEISHNCNHIS
jgi:hypothetical protein